MGSVPGLGAKLEFLYAGLPAERHGRLPVGYLVCATQAEFAQRFGLTSQAVANAVNGISGQRAPDEPSAPMERAIAYRYGFGPPQSRVGPGQAADRVDEAWEDWFQREWPGWRGTAEAFARAYRDAVDRGSIAPIPPEAEPLRSALAVLARASSRRKRGAPQERAAASVPLAPGNAVADLLRFELTAGQATGTSATLVVELNAHPVSRELEGERIEMSLFRCRVELVPENGERLARANLLGLEAPRAFAAANAIVEWTGTRGQPCWLVTATAGALDGPIDEEFATIEHGGALGMAGTVRVDIGDLPVRRGGSAEEGANRRRILDRLALIRILEAEDGQLILSTDRLP